MKKQQQQVPQPQVVKQLTITQPENFWTYLPPHQLSPALDQYLQVNQKDIYTIQNSGGFFLDQIKQVLLAVRGHLHPAIQHVSQDSQMIRFSNIKVDFLTLKLLQVFQNNCQATVYDFKNNSLTEQELEIIYAIVQYQNVNKVFIEYNYPNIARLSALYNIEFLYLRGNQIDDKMIVQFAQTLHNRLKILELGNNKIGRQGCDALAAYLGKANGLEYLGLANNIIKSLLDVKELCNSFGKFLLSNEESQKIQDLELQREQQIQKYTKSKKKFTEDMLIQVPSYIIVDNQFYTVQNKQFKFLNLSDNSLPEVDRDHIDRFMQRQLETFTLSLVNNPFENSTKAKWRKKFKKQIMI